MDEDLEQFKPSNESYSHATFNRGDNSQNSQGKLFNPQSFNLGNQSSSIRPKALPMMSKTKTNLGKLDKSNIIKKPRGQVVALLWLLLKN